MAKKNMRVPKADFGEQLILFRYFLSLFGISSLMEVSLKLNSAEYEGYDENQNTYFYRYFTQLCTRKSGDVRLSRDKLRLYDENICRYVRQIGAKRGGIVLKYYQYMGLLFTEIYLDRYFTDRAEFLKSLNRFAEQAASESQGRICTGAFDADKINKLSFMCATGSGKTLMMHVNILQYLYYLKRAGRTDRRMSVNRIILLSPNEGLSVQHLGELKLSSVPARIFDKNLDWVMGKEDVLIIDMNKLKEEGKVRTVSVDSFEKNNLVLVDEAHRGLSGDVWYDYRTRMSEDGGFAFEYSATFKQALKAMNLTKTKDKALFEEYCRSIIMDYSYKYFYNDGYGKEYKIYNLRDNVDEEQRKTYLTGCMLAFYQQIKLFETYPQYKEFHIEKPLLVFVGNRVTAKTSAGELTDVEEVVAFLDSFISDRMVTERRIRAILEENSGITNRTGRELFAQCFRSLIHVFGGQADAGVIYNDILRLIFHTETISGTHHLCLENMRQIPGEIAIRAGDTRKYFGVISIGDTAAFMKCCEKNGLIIKNEEFISDSLFTDINRAGSDINVLIGSRKFMEGWNSWRVSTMGFINFARGEGAAAIQLFGRGVRLKGFGGCLKRSHKMDDRSVSIPKYIEELETLNIFGIRAQYMEEFRRYLEMEDVPVNERVHEFYLPVRNRLKELEGRPLYVIKVRDGVDFKKQAARMILDVPDQGFERYLIKNKIIIDCRARVQMIESGYDGSAEVMDKQYIIDDSVLPLLNYDRIFTEMEQYKEDKNYYNISLVKSKLRAIMAYRGWYGLIVPYTYLSVDSYQRLEAVTDYCLLALKQYMDKFYIYQKEKWEAPLLEYQPLKENDKNFIDSYRMTYTDEGRLDTTADELDSFVKEIAVMCKTGENAKDHCWSPKAGRLKGRLTAFDYRLHLYAPLLCLTDGGGNIQVSPVSLNEGEKLFVDLLKDFVEKHSCLFHKKSVYLLRNRSRAGIGFFEAGNFYPDYMMWIDEEEIQYINFIDPKGLLRIMPDDPKIGFYKKIKEMENRLRQTCTDKRVILNSFIMSVTGSAELAQWWGMSEAEREERNVFCLDGDDCIEKMIKKIFSQKI